MFGLSIVRTDELQRLQGVEKSKEKELDKKDKDCDTRLENRSNYLQTKIDAAHASYKVITEKALAKSDASFLTLADNLFYLALKTRKDLLIKMKEKIFRLLGEKEVTSS